MARMDGPKRMQQLINGYGVTQAVHAAATLGLSDLLGGEPVGVADLAAATDCDPRSLHRLLRALVSVVTSESPTMAMQLSRSSSANSRRSRRGPIRETGRGWETPADELLELS